ncbi:M14 family metallopeptidase [Zavarzinia compransoris]|uniref:DUF2817 domain-containing protein n=1 Tax=Zavarzinia compransoris TaxID=1264899 RepID=A0A317DWS0_9PROT|nr:M14 family metallopeptidase [Zavarzinia compransoris]PWR19168.1 DUF2817 domain-containing protein [Zavarzinia compransoris]TDP49184.1 uncharacterized protein DUF2817 [Zavarzinia compransoris]
MTDSDRERPGHHHFSPDYATARNRLVAACAARQWTVESHRHPLRGPDGGPIALDVVRVGPAGARRRLALFAGTHGVEGYFGSAVIHALIADGHLDSLPPEVAVVMVHGLNPWGFAWTRRVTEDNVDLNRNWIDFAAGRPPAGDYAAIAEALLPESLEPGVLAIADAQLRRFAREHGLGALQAAITRGQYDYPDGLYFGGFGPGWSRRRIAEIAAAHLAGADEVIAVDFHTGLGPYGTGELISIAAPGSPDFRRAEDLFGPGVKSTLSGDSVSAHLSGSLDEGLAGLVAPCPLAFVALEVGTRDGQAVIAGLRDDNWLHLRGRLDAPEAKAIRARLKDAFAPDEPEWQDRVLALGVACVTGALSRL